ncbi:MAG: hypothetical protein LR015_06835 [Verrucomicrobia bacterium]|nr:hypothetical protein [Verrucomicrobiota bacterium]
MAIDLADIQELNNNINARVRLRYSADGGSASTGLSILFDNIRFSARRLASGFNDWRLAKFGALDHPDAAPHADPANRGIPNLIEYALGLDLLANPHSGYLATQRHYW